MNIENFKRFVIPTNEDSNEDKSICANCHGNCCEHMGCHISPREIKDISAKSLINFIESSECVSIDWWEGDVIPDGELEKVYYLRMRNRGFRVEDPSHGGRCIALDKEGCVLDFNYRPAGGRGLLPRPDRRCEVVYSKKQCVEEWREYQDILSEVVKYFSDKGEVEPEKRISLFEALDMMLGVVDN